MTNTRLLPCASGLLIIIPVLVLLGSCRFDEPYAAGPDKKLSFSNDTIVFDTVFTTIGTATRSLMVYNPHPHPLLISSIRLARGNASPFRLNIDGQATLHATDVSVAANDSMFIFIRATIDPNDQTGPMIETDSIVFLTNHNIQDVKLVAWGEDAHFYNNAVIASDYAFHSDKPHVIYGFLAVDSSFTLTVYPGTRLHFHRNAFLLVYRDATLKVLGTADQPVIFQGNRTELYYRDLPAQWGHPIIGACIYFFPGSINNMINHAIIKNGIVGIKCDTLGNSQNPTLRMYNTEIRNMSGIGLLARGTWIEAGNILIANSGTHALAILYGGTYDFRHLTIGNFWNRTVRQTPSLLLNNYYYYYETVIARPLTKAFFGNSVIYGNLQEELRLDKSDLAQFSFEFSYCLIRSDTLTSQSIGFNNCIFLQDSIFRNPELHQLEPDSLSPLINAGNRFITEQSLFDLRYDLRGTSRLNDAAPDIGAIEAVPEE